jgi:hypothetical protein
MFLSRCGMGVFSQSKRFCTLAWDSRFFSARAERGELRENCETAPTTRGPYGQSFGETVQYSAEVIAR